MQQNKSLTKTFSLYEKYMMRIFSFYSILFDLSFQLTLSTHQGYALQSMGKGASQCWTLYTRNAIE